MLLKKPNTLNYPIVFWNIAKFFQIVFRYLKHLDRLFVYLFDLCDKLNTTTSFYLVPKIIQDQRLDCS